MTDEQTAVVAGGLICGLLLVIVATAADLIGAWLERFWQRRRLARSAARFIREGL